MPKLASLIAPRALIIEAARAPEITLPPNKGGAPGRLVTPALEDVRAELARAKKLSGELNPAQRLDLATSGDGNGPFGIRSRDHDIHAFACGRQPTGKTGRFAETFAQKFDLSRA